MTVKLQDILESPAIYVPFSVAVNGAALQRTREVECSICKLCQLKPCLKSNTDEVAVCSLGVRYHSYRVLDDRIVVFGLAPHEAISKRNFVAFKGRRFPNNVVNKWVNDLRELFKTLEIGLTRARAEALDSVHDLSKLASEVASLASQLAGDNLNETPPIPLALLKSSELLVKEFERMELLMNPASAATGRVYTQIYRLCHKYAQIIDLAFARPNNKRVHMSGQSYIEMRTFESVNVLIFSLIGNAAKYAMSGETVRVVVNDLPNDGTVDLIVTSTGPLIEEAELKRIFDRGFRGKWAERFVHEGHGLGLYLAKIVADALGTVIRVKSDALGYARDGIPCAENRFAVKFHQI